MTALSAFYPDIMPECPGATAPMIDVALRNTVIEFCEMTLIHQLTLDLVTAIKDVFEYDLDPPEGFRVAKVMKVWFKGQELSPTNLDSVRGPDGFADFVGDYNPAGAPPRMFAQRDNRTLLLLPKPDQRYSNAVTIRVALVPLRDMTTVEDFLWQDWGEIIAHGAKARLQLVPGKPYSNSEAATINQARYVSGRNEAMQRARRGFNRSDLRIKLRRI